MRQVKKDHKTIMWFTVTFVDQGPVEIISSCQGGAGHWNKWDNSRTAGPVQAGKGRPDPNMTSTNSDLKCAKAGAEWPSGADGICPVGRSVLGPIEAQKNAPKMP